MAHDVFISYAFEDKPTADAVCAALEGRGVRCWIAPRDVLPGTYFPAAIISAISTSRVLVLVFSARSNESPHVMREVERAVSKGIPIIPLRIENVPLSPSMEYFISTPHWLDALTPPLKKHLAHLSDTVSLLLARSEVTPSEEPGQEPPLPAVVTPSGPRVVLARPTTLAAGLATMVLVAIVTIMLFQGQLPAATTLAPSVGGTFSAPLATLPRPSSHALPTNLGQPTATARPSPSATIAAPTIEPGPGTEFAITPLFTAPGDRTGGIAWDGVALWLSSGTELFKVDPGGRVLGVFTPPDYTPEGLTWDGSQFWLFTTNESEIYGFSVSDAAPAADPLIHSFFDAPVRTIGATPHGLAWDGSSLWFSDYYSLYELDTRGRVLRTLAFGQEIAGVAWDGQGLWLAAQDWPRDAELSAVDDEGNVLSSVDLPLVEISALAWGDGYLLAAGAIELAGRTTIYRLDVERPD